MSETFYSRPGGVPGRTFTDRILDVLPPPGEPVTIFELVERIGAENRRVVQAIDVLRRRGFVKRVHRGRYILTPAGRAFQKSDDHQITSGPNGPHTGPWRRGGGKFKAAFWAALRMSDSAVTIDDVLALIPETLHGRNPTDNAYQFLSRLQTAGYVAELARREAGTALTSNGFKRWRLIKNTGPKTPYWSLKYGRLIDPNLPFDTPIGGAPPAGPPMGTGGGDA